MKYPYKKSTYYGSFAFTVIFIVSMAIIIDGFSVVGIITVALMVCALFAVFAKNDLDRYVEILDESIRFGSYVFKRKGQKYFDPPATVEIRYENIYVLEAKQLPLFGIYTISIDASGLKQNVFLSRGFENYKEIVVILCKKVEESNPDAYIDPKIQKFIDK